MARSGGGGSRGGGSRGGGSRSSSRGRSGSRNSTRRLSRHRFPGAMRYSYIGRNGDTQYIYTDRPMKKKSLGSLIVEMLFFVPFVAIFFAMFGTFSSDIFGFFPPKPLESNVSYETSYITDTIDVIDNEREVVETLKEFHQKTGIAPHILTINHDEWKRYDSFEVYALEKYYDMFYDEEHFLLVYSEEYYEENDYTDWAWECVIGDYTIDILTENKLSKFNDDFYEELSRSSSPLSADIITVFSDPETRFMKADPDFESLFVGLFFMLFWGGIVGLFIFNAIRDYVMSQKDYTYAPEDGMPQSVPSSTLNNNLLEQMMNGETMVMSRTEFDNLMNQAKENDGKVTFETNYSYSDSKPKEMESLNTASYPEPERVDYSSSDYTDTYGDKDPWEL